MAAVYPPPIKGKSNGLQIASSIYSLRPQAPSAWGGFGFYLIRATEYRFRIK